MAVTAPAFEAIGAPAPSNRRRYTEDQVSIGRVLLRMLGGFMLAIFVLPYTIMFFGSVKTKAQIRSVDPTYLPTEWHGRTTSTCGRPRDATAAEPHLDHRHRGLRDRARARRRDAGRVLHRAIPFPGRFVFLFLVIVTQMLQPAVLTSGLFRQFVTLGLIEPGRR